VALHEWHERSKKNVTKDRETSMPTKKRAELTRGDISALRNLKGLIVIAHDGNEDTDVPRGYRKGILAENIHVVPTPGFPEMVNVEFDFLCPNCGQRHWAREIACSHVLSSVGWALKCGWVSVRMPWALTPARDMESIYGQTRESEDRIDTSMEEKIREKQERETAQEAYMEKHPNPQRDSVTKV
jgi:hypothetical protein